MDGDSIVIATTAGRRLLYFGCFLVFLASFILNVDFRSDFSPPRAWYCLYVRAHDSLSRSRRMERSGGRSKGFQDCAEESVFAGFRF
jgi:hypothetical protein